MENNGRVEGGVLGLGMPLSLRSAFGVLGVLALGSAAEALPSPPFALGSGTGALGSAGDRLRLRCFVAKLEWGDM